MILRAGRRRLHSDRGAVGIEYAIAAVVIALGLVAAAGTAREAIAGMLSNISATALDSAPGAPPADPKEPKEPKPPKNK